MNFNTQTQLDKKQDFIFIFSESVSLLGPIPAVLALSSRSVCLGFPLSCSQVQGFPLSHHQRSCHFQVQGIHDEGVLEGAPIYQVSVMMRRISLCLHAFQGPALGHERKESYEAGASGAYVLVLDLASRLSGVLVPQFYEPQTSLSLTVQQNTFYSLDKYFFPLTPSGTLCFPIPFGSYKLYKVFCGAK